VPRSKIIAYMGRSAAEGEARLAPGNIASGMFTDRWNGVKPVHNAIVDDERGGRKPSSSDRARAVRSARCRSRSSSTRHQRAARARDLAVCGRCRALQAGEDDDAVRALIYVDAAWAQVPDTPSGRLETGRSMLTPNQRGGIARRDGRPSAGSLAACSATGADGFGCLSPSAALSPFVQLASRALTHGWSAARHATQW
jgi:hypothetical protein